MQLTERVMKQYLGAASEIEAWIRILETVS